ncbi:MAG: hypothetical protein WCP97_00040 [bacterium]
MPHTTKTTKPTNPFIITPLTFSKALEQTCKIFKKAFIACFPAYGIICLFIYGSSLVTAPLQQTLQSESLQITNLRTSNPEEYLNILHAGRLTQLTVKNILLELPSILLIFFSLLTLLVALHYFSQVSNKPSLLSVYKKTLSIFPRFLFTGFIFLLAFVIGTVFFIIPGIYILLVWQFWAWIGIEENKFYLKSFKMSSQLVKNNFLKLLLYWIAILIGNFLVGFIITKIIPWTEVRIVLNIPVTIFTTLFLGIVFYSLKEKQSIKTQTPTIETQ